MHFKHLNMKVVVWDESGKKVFRSEGEPKKVIRETLSNLKLGLQIIDWEDIMASLDILNLTPEFEKMRVQSKMKYISEEENKRR